MLTLKLRHAIDTCRGPGLILPARGVVRVRTEDIVCGYLHEKPSGFLHGICEDARSFSVEPAAQGLVTFCLVDIRIGCTVHYAADSSGLYHKADSFRVCNVKELGLQTFCCHYIGESVGIACACTHPAHLPAELAVRACYQYVHCLYALTV